MHKEVSRTDNAILVLVRTQKCRAGAGQTRDEACGVRVYVPQCGATTSLRPSVVTANTISIQIAIRRTLSEPRFDVRSEFARMTAVAPKDATAATRRFAP